MTPAAAELVAALEEERTRGTFPSYQALVCERGVTLLAAAGGAAVIEPELVVAGAGTTLYDLASLTKPLVTALLALSLAEEGVLALDAPIGRLLDVPGAAWLAQVTPLDLLVHRAGFQAWAPLYLSTPPVLARYARAAALLAPAGLPGQAVVYSDLGYLVLGALLERVTGKGFGELARKRIVDPVAALLPGEIAFPPGPELRSRIAATERGNAYERRLAGADPGDRRFRDAMLWGEVNDGNAAALGGVAPHAGLFATARATALLAGEYLDGGSLLGPAARSLSRADLTAPLGAHRSAAFELAGNPGSAAAGSLPDGAPGHTGFTGTSVWLEPERGRIYVLLTNRVHPVVPEGSLNPVRRRFHAAACRLEGPALAPGRSVT